MGLLTRIEDILSLPMEALHARKGFHPVDLNRMALKTLEQGCRKGIRKMYAPNTFRVFLHPADHDELSAFLQGIAADIKSELLRVVRERDYLLAGDLQVKIIKDEDVQAGKPQIQGFMEGQTEPASSLVLPDEETGTEPVQGAPAREDQDPKTVIMLEEPVSKAEHEFEQGMQKLRTGRPDQALDWLSKAGNELERTPQFHAAMGVTLELLGRRSESRTHWQRFQELEGPRPEVQQRPARLEPKAVPAGRLVIQEYNIELRLEPDGIMVHNPDRHQQVLVNGRVRSAARLQSGDRLQIGRLDMTYSQA